MLTLGRDIVELQQFADTVGRSRSKGLLAQGHATEIGGMKTVDILFGSNGVDDVLLINVLRHRQLDDQSISGVISVDLVYARQEFGLGDVFRQPDQVTLETGLLAGDDLRLYIRFTGGVMTHQYNGHMRLAQAGCYVARNFFGYIADQMLCAFLAVQQLHLHISSSCNKIGVIFHRKITPLTYLASPSGLE